MYFRTITVILILLGGPPARATALKGVVLANELGGSPLANVSVSAMAGANPTVTNPDGTFTLEFPQKRPGETVRLIVRARGYVVVNDIMLELVLPADSDAKPITILLCREGDRLEMASRFYRLKSFQPIDEKYESRLKELEKLHNADAATIEQLRKDRDQARAAAAKAADELAREAPHKSSEPYREAMRFFLDGRIDQGIKVLDDDELNCQLKVAKMKETEAKATIEQATQAWVLKARLLTLEFRFDEAERAYESAIEASPDNFRANFDFAVFSQELKHYKQAAASYGRCLQLARQSGSSAHIAMTLNNLGNLDGDQNRMDEARQHYEEALKISRELAQKNPDTYLTDVAMTLNQPGDS